MLDKMELYHFSSLVLKFLIVRCFGEDIGVTKFQNPETGTVWKVIKPAPEPNFEPYLLSTSQLIRREGFSVEEHAALTEDGYTVALHRIVSPVSGSDPQPAILMMHGFLIASDHWLQHGREHDLPYLLADAGFDVWLGDFRGNCYSRRHETLSPDDDQFWDFGPHEWGYYDIPAAIEYIKYQTQHQRITYVGYSIGCGAFYIMSSTRPVFNNYIDGAIMLAPFVYGPRIKKAKPLYLHLTKFAINGYKQHDKFEVIKRNRIHLKAVQRLTRIDAPSFKIMFQMFMELFGEDLDQLDMLKFKEIVSSFGAGTSLKALEHMVQMYETSKFCNFDFGKAGNRIHYNATSPPDYNLTRVSVPSYIYYGDNDYLVDPESVDQLCHTLPNVVKSARVPYKKFSHIDFLLANDAKALLYDDVMSDVFRIVKSDNEGLRNYYFDNQESRDYESQDIWESPFE